MAMHAEAGGPSAGCAPSDAATEHAGDPVPLAVALVAALEEALLASRRLLVAVKAGGGPHPAVPAYSQRAPAGGDVSGDGSSVTRSAAAEAGATIDVLTTCLRLSGPARLSRRETEVLGLLAAGRSNREIAQALFLSPRTVQRHVANAYLKIGAHNKADATAYALRHHRA